MFGKYAKIYIICEINTIQTITIQNALAHNSTFKTQHCRRHCLRHGFALQAQAYSTIPALPYYIISIIL